MYVCGCMLVQNPWKPEESVRSLELELQAIVCHPRLVLWTELRTLERTVCALKRSVISPAPEEDIFNRRIL